MVGDFGYGGHDVIDVAGFFGNDGEFGCNGAGCLDEVLHATLHVFEFAKSGISHGSCFVSNVGDIAHGFVEFLRSGGDFFNSSSDFVTGSAEVVNSVFLSFGSCRDFGSRGNELDTGLFYLTDEAIEVIDHLGDSLVEHAGFITAIFGGGEGVRTEFGFFYVGESRTDITFGNEFGNTGDFGNGVSDASAEVESEGTDDDQNDNSS